MPLLYLPEELEDFSIGDLLAAHQELVRLSRCGIFQPFGEWLPVIWWEI